MDASDMGADLKEVLITPERLQARVAELAAQIDADYAGQDLLLVGVLKGAVMVLADLARAIRLPVEMDWMAVSSYGSGTKSSGVVRILKDLDSDITGRHVLVVEDIVDSGLTLSWLVGNLKSRGPASVRVCVMLRKPAAARMDVDVAYTGFEIGDEFVIGYGLDYAERYRNLPFIGTLAPHVYGGARVSPVTARRARTGGCPAAGAAPTGTESTMMDVVAGAGVPSPSRIVCAVCTGARCMGAGAQAGVPSDIPEPLRGIEGSKAWALGRQAVPPGVGGT